MILADSAGGLPTSLTSAVHTCLISDCWHLHLSARRLFLAVRANFAHAQNVRGTMIHQPTNDGSCRWTPHSLMSPVWSLRPARSQEELSYSCPQLQFPSLFPSLSQFPAPWPALPNKQLVLQSSTLKSASRSQMKANKCIVHEYTSVHSGLEDHEFCFCCLPMYWLLHSASGGPLWWCRKNWVCYLSQ